MRILQVIPNVLKGGAERLVIDTCLELARRNNIEVKLVVFSDSEKRIYAVDGVDFSVINAKVELSIFRKNSINVIDLQKLIIDFQPDIIHSHLFVAEIISRSCLFPCAKWFTHFHDNMVQVESFGLSTLFSTRKITNYFEKRYLLKRYAANGGNHFIAISNDGLDYLKRVLPDYSISFLPNSINYKRFFFERPDKGIGKTKLINAGTFVKKKNQQFLISVAHELFLRDQSFEMHFLGNGPDRNELMKASESLIKAGLVFFHGEVKDVEEHFKNADIYIHSATYEPLGLVLLEAMAAGLPVITLDGRGNRDLIVEGENGFMLFEPDAKKFADKIIELWENKTLYKEMSSFGQEFAKKYDVKDYVDRLLELYRSGL